MAIGPAYKKFGGATSNAEASEVVLSPHSVSFSIYASDLRTQDMLDIITKQNLVSVVFCIFLVFSSCF